MADDPLPFPVRLLQWVGLAAQVYLIVDAMTHGELTIHTKWWLKQAENYVREQEAYKSAVNHTIFEAITIVSEQEPNE